LDNIGFMPGPWNNWYHCVAGTYGSWLYGDARGFRTYKHREHVEGDYKNPPPPGTYDQLYRMVKWSMKRDAVVLSPDERRFVCAAVVEKIELYGIEAIALAVAPTHLHVLMRVRPMDDGFYESRGMAIPRLCYPALPPKSALRDGRDPLPRHVLGLLKKHVSHEHRRSDFAKRPGGLWAKRSKIIAIEHREHHVAAAQYIMNHVDEGAAVWRVGDEVGDIEMR
jgi:hypothetical protein